MFRSLLILILIVLSPLAFSCVTTGNGLPQLEWAYGKSEFIFFGKVKEVDANNTKGIIKVKFQVIHGYRGVTEKEITMYATNGGGHYNRNGSTSSNSCGCTFELESTHMMAIRLSVEKDKDVPVGVPYKRYCISKTEVIDPEEPNVENNLLLWYISQREQGINPNWKEAPELNNINKKNSMFGKSGLTPSDLF